jgi:outer membrane protein TolC
MPYFRNTVRHPCNLVDARTVTAVKRFRYLLARSARQRVLLIALLLPLALSSTVLASPVQSKTTNTLSLEDAVSMAVKGNPGLAEMQARAQSMEDIPSQVGALPDPMLTLGALNLPTDTFSLDQEPMTQLLIGVEQSLPFPGKLGLKERAAEIDADAAASNVDEARLLLIRNVRHTWWQIYYLDRALDIVARNQDLLRQFVQIAQTKYKVGEGLQQDVLLAQVELSKLLDSEIRLQGLRQQQVPRLNALLDRSTSMPVQLPVEVDEDLDRLLPESQLFERAGKVRPLLEQRRLEVEAARTRRDFAKRDTYPDFKLGAAYGFREGDNPDGSSRADFASIRLGVSLPLYAGRKQDKAVDQRTSELLQRQNALQDEWNKVQAEISAALADYQRASEQVLLFRAGIIPQARQTVASMLSGYQVSKVDFLNLVNAQITLYNFETQYWSALSEANQALARLDAAVGEGGINE